MCQDIGKPLSILPDASLLEATRLMTERKFNRLMVKGRYSNMLGTITATDLVLSLRTLTLTLTLTLTPTLTPTLSLVQAKLNSNSGSRCRFIVPD